MKSTRRATPSCQFRTPTYPSGLTSALNQAFGAKSVKWLRVWEIEEIMVGN